MKGWKKDKKMGFTIIELLVVLATIAIILGIAVPKVKGMQDEARFTKAKGETRLIQAALESYYIHQTPNAYPASSTTIINSTLKSASPNIISTVLYDPFLASNTEYNYAKSSNGKYYVIWSVGLDGTAGITGIGDTGTVTGTAGDDIYATNGNS